MSGIVIVIIMYHGLKSIGLIPIQASKLIAIFAVCVESISCYRGTIMLSTYRATYLGFVEYEE
jgi:hypothetical protein